MHEKIKQPWRGKKDWVEKIRSQAGDLESKAPKWEDDAEKHNEYFAARKTDAWYFREMARLTHQIESEIKGSLGWDAVSSTLQLGKLITELRFKTDWEQVVLFGAHSFLAEGQYHFETWQGSQCPIHVPDQQ